MSDAGAFDPHGVTPKMAPSEMLNSNHSNPAIVWFRLDLRLADNPALRAAMRRGSGVIPVFIYAPEEEAPWPPGAASRWWLHESLLTLETALRVARSRLVIRQGPSLATLQNLVAETRAAAVFWNRRYEPAVIARDAMVKQALNAAGIMAESFNGALLHEPWTAQNQSGQPFQIFTPFWKRCLAKSDPGAPLPSPKHVPGLPAVAPWPKSLPIEALELNSKINWTSGLRAAWQPGEAGAQSRLKRFLTDALPRYDLERDRPDLSGTSRLSPHLHFGEISPRQIWHAVARVAEKNGPPAARWREGRFVAELGWREFAHHLLFHFPHSPNQPLRVQFKDFPWRWDPTGLRAWQQGRTGYPIVDAGLRELWATGWMHNRVRMIVASFLVKDLLISWEEGARWFWDTLVDADLANNTLGWQWTTGCGADAAPFFRIFNPSNQSEKFDPHGDYIRRWCPELAKLPVEHIHAPHKASSEVLARAEVKPGENYPEALVNHGIAREIALAAFARIKSTPRHRTGANGIVLSRVRRV